MPHSKTSNRSNQKHHFLEQKIRTITKLIHDQKKSIESLMSKISLNQKPSDWSAPASNDEILESAATLAVSKARSSLLSSQSASSDYCCAMASSNVNAHGWEQYTPSPGCSASSNTASCDELGKTPHTLGNKPSGPPATEETGDLLVNKCIKLIEGSKYSWLNGNVEEEISRRLKERMSRQEEKSVDSAGDITSSRVKALNTRVSNLINEIDQTVNSFEKIEHQVVSVEEMGRMLERRSKKLGCKKVKSKVTTACKGLSVDQALEGVEKKIFISKEISFNNWLKEKGDKEKARRLAVEQAEREQRERREKQRELNTIAFERWCEAAKNRPRPLPIMSDVNIAPNATQSGPSLRWNPIPWVDDWHIDKPAKPTEPAVKVRAKSSAGSVKCASWRVNPRLAGLLKEADCWIETVLGDRRGLSPDLRDEVPERPWNVRQASRSDTRTDCGKQAWSSTDFRCQWLKTGQNNKLRFD